MMKRALWHRPVLRTRAREGGGRQTSWLELFFDLVFVVVIAELSHHLAADISLKGILGFGLLFLPVWWIWVGGVSYAERFENDSAGYRVVVFLQMLPVACLAFFAQGSLEDASVGFALSFVAAKCLLTVLWAQAGYHNTAFRPVATRSIIVLSAGSACFLASIFIPLPGRFAFWVAGILVDLSAPCWTVKHRKALPPVSSAKVSERFGLFTIIVLGEAIIAVIRGVSESQNIDLGTVVVAVLGMALAFSMWWVYFDFVAHREPKPSLGWESAWVYLHAPLLMGIAMIAAGIQHVTAERVGTCVAPGVESLIIGSAAVVLAAIGMLELTLRTDASGGRNIGPLAKVLTAAILPLLCLANVWMGPGMLLAILIVAFLPYIVFSSVLSGDRSSTPGSTGQ
jgi:low temperature requirement protein LtrA